MNEIHSLVGGFAAERPPDAGLDITVFRPEDDWRFANKRVIFNHLEQNS